MVTIVDLEAINKYRQRREMRKNRLDDEWITVKGTHVLVDDEGNAKSGGKLKGMQFSRAKSGEAKSPEISKEMSPYRTDYDYSLEDDREDWIHKNVEKLRGLYDFGGGEAIDSEWYKFRMAKNSVNIHRISKEDADAAVYDSPLVTQSLYDGWFRNEDSSYKPKLTSAIVSTPEMRNAALNLAYENYRHNTDNPMGFEEFLVTPIKMYRGGHGQKHVKDDVFSAYTFDRKMAEHFAGPNGVITEAEIRPIDTYGSMRAVGEAEIWVPREIAPNKNRDGFDGVDYDKIDRIKLAFEEAPEEEGSGDGENIELIDSIIRDAEMIKLFADNGEETGKKILERCFDSIQKTVMQLTAKNDLHKDGAFFAGELDDNLGEKYIEYPEIAVFRERRQKRLDAKDEGRWVTTENDHRIHLNEEGVPDKGNPHVLRAITNGTKTAEQVGMSRVKRIRGNVQKSLDAYKEAEGKVKEAAKKYADANKKFKIAERKLDFVDNVFKKTLDHAGIKEGDGDKLKKEVEELEKKRGENPGDSEIEAEYNNKKFLLSEYEDVYGEETKELRKNFNRIKKDNDDAKKELDGHISDRKSSLEEARKHMGGKNVQSIKFYTEDERQEIKTSVLGSSGMKNLSDEEKQVIGESIDRASDAQLSVLKKTFGKARILKNEETFSTECSHYSSGNGCMYLDPEDRSKPRVFWHEYGHFMDDFAHSGLEDSVVTFGEGTEYEGSSRSFSDILTDDLKIFGKDGAADIQEMFDGVAPGKFEVTVSDDGSHMWVRDKKTGEGLDGDSKSAFELQTAFDSVIEDYIKGGPNGGELEEYYKSIGYPGTDEMPKIDEYIEYYVTPKRKLERSREKYKGAREDYYAKLREFFDEQEKIKEAHPDFAERERELYAKRGEREKHTPAVCDCLCAAMLGQVFSIYGCHDRDYYRHGDHAANEWAANIHQMMFMQDTEAIGLLTKLMPRTMKKVKAAYNEYLWRNLSE